MDLEFVDEVLENNEVVKEAGFAHELIDVAGEELLDLVEVGICKCLGRVRVHGGSEAVEKFQATKIRALSFGRWIWGGRWCFNSRN